METNQNAETVMNLGNGTKLRLFNETYFLEFQNMLFTILKSVKIATIGDINDLKRFIKEANELFETEQLEATEFKRKTIGTQKILLLNGYILIVSDGELGYTIITPMDVKLMMPLLNN